ncbi:hydrogenase accessory protein HypB, partial [Streptomyces mirabilis]
AEAVEFDEAAFRANVERVNPGVDVLLTSARRPPHPRRARHARDGQNATGERRNPEGDAAPTC